MVVSATALSEKVPDPKLRPHGFMLRVGDLIDLDETAQQLVAAGYQRVDQVEDRGQFAIRGGLLDVYPGDRGARGPRRPVRHRDRGAALVLHLHPAQPGGDRLRRDLARGRARARAPRAGRDRRATDEDRPDIAELLPVEHFRDAAGPDPRAHADHRRRRGGRRADAARPLGGRLHGVRRPGRARPLRQPDEDQRGAGRAGRGAPEQHLRRPADPDPRARPPTSPRATCARPSPSSRSSCARDYTTVVAWPQLGAAERAAYNLDRIKASLNGATRGLVFTEANLRDGFVAPGLKLAAFPEHRLIHRKKASHAADAQGPRPAALASPTCARATTSSTRTTASRASPASTPRPSPASRATT